MAVEPTSKTGAFQGIGRRVVVVGDVVVVERAGVALRVQESAAPPAVGVEDEIKKLHVPGFTGGIGSLDPDRLGPVGLEVARLDWNAEGPLTSVVTLPLGGGSAIETVGA